MEISFVYPTHTQTFFSIKILQYANVCIRSCIYILDEIFKVYGANFFWSPHLNSAYIVHTQSHRWKKIMFNMLCCSLVRRSFSYKNLCAISIVYDDIHLIVPVCRKGARLVMLVPAPHGISSRVKARRRRMQTQKSNNFIKSFLLVRCADVYVFNWIAAKSER